MKVKTNPFSLGKWVPTLALAALLMPGFLNQTLAAHDWVEVDGIVGGKILYDTTTGIILDCETTVTSATIPSQILGTDIVALGKGSFSQCTLLQSVYIPDSVLEFEVPEVGESYINGVFMNCSSLISVRIPETITEIPYGTFRNCSSLPSRGIELHEGITYVGGAAFEGCEMLTSFEFPNSVAKIGSGIFTGCKNLYQVTFPEGLTRLNDQFTGCTMLTSVYLPASLTAISNDVFHLTANLREIDFGGTQAQWESASINKAYNIRLTTADINYNSERPGTVTAYYSNWAKDFVISAAKTDLITPSLGENYTVSITREQIAELLVNLVEVRTRTELETSSLTTFTDTKNTSVLKAHKAGIINGTTDTTFSPEDNATREQIATMIYKAILVIEESTNTTFTTKNSNLTGYIDQGNLSVWAKDAVGILANNGIMSGTSSDTLSPKENTTIEQCLVFVVRVFEKAALV